MEKTVQLVNRNGEKLFGIAHYPPDTNYRKTAINILNPGIKYRVAPNRLNVKMARALSSLGFLTFRFDPAGIGDSEGDLPDKVLVPDIFELIQKGHFIQDIIDCNNFIVSNYDVNNIILIGNCGGAITSLLASEFDSKVVKLCLIDTPINLRTSRISFADKIVGYSNRSDHLLNNYFKKLFRIKSWQRLFSLKSDFKAIVKLINIQIAKKVPFCQVESESLTSIRSLCDQKVLNPLFFSSFDHAMDARIPILFILAENDPGTEFFTTYFQKCYLKEAVPVEKADKLIDVCLIENANHIYTLTEWQNQLIGSICKWLRDSD